MKGVRTFEAQNRGMRRRVCSRNYLNHLNYLNYPYVSHRTRYPARKAELGPPNQHREGRGNPTDGRNGVRIQRWKTGMLSIAVLMPLQGCGTRRALRDGVIPPPPGSGARPGRGRSQPLPAEMPALGTRPGAAEGQYSQNASYNPYFSPSAESDPPQPRPSGITAIIHPTYENFLGPASSSWKDLQFASRRPGWSLHWQSKIGNFLLYNHIPPF